MFTLLILIFFTGALIANCLHYFTITGFVTTPYLYRLFRSLFHAFYLCAALSQLFLYVDLVILTYNWACESSQENVQQVSRRVKMQECWLAVAFIVACLVCILILAVFDYVAEVRKQAGYKVRRGFPAGMFLAVWVAFVVSSVLLL